MSTFKPPSEMVERVGEALSAACMEEFGATWNYDVRQKFARAAIEAMREPTEEMCNAGKSTEWPMSLENGTVFLVPGFDAKPSSVWRRMFDAAL